jgi:hypothetical protein
VMILAVPLLWVKVAGGVESERLAEKKSPQTRASLGPRNTDFNSPGYKIIKVVRLERTLNALGIAGQFGKTNKVGKYVELPKRLESSERGEHFLITWKYSRKGPAARSSRKYETDSQKESQKTDIALPPENITLRFDYKLSKEEEVQTLKREYPNPKPGKYRVRFENTGGDYGRNGRVEYWRVSVLADGERVAGKESFLWPIFEAGKKIRNGDGT